MLETATVGRFAKVGNYSSYCRCVDSARVSNGKKKGEGNVKNGNKYLAWAFVEAANFAIRYCPEAKRFFLGTQESQDQRHRGAQGYRAQTGAGVLPHAAGTEAVRTEALFYVTGFRCTAASQYWGLAGQPGELIGRRVCASPFCLIESPKP